MLRPISPHFDKLPPVIQLLLRELVAEDESDIFKRLEQLAPELQRQAQWSLESFDYVDLRAAPDFSRHTVGLYDALNPFIPDAKCFNFDCRVHLAKQIGRSVGIYADRVLLPDLLTDRIAWTAEWDESAILALATEALTLLSVAPLLEAGLFEFYSPYYVSCTACRDAFDQQVEQLTVSSISRMESDLKVERNGNRLTLDTSYIYGSSMVWSRDLSKKERKALKKGGSLEDIVLGDYAHMVDEHIRATLNTIRFTSRLGGTTFANSRVGLLAARELDASIPDKREIREWESERSATLPWLGDLSMSQVMELRQEADRALPRFRERMTALMGSEKAGAMKASDLVSALREEAAEVEQELLALDLPGQESFRTGYGLLGITVSVYGFASEFLHPGAAIGGLFGLLYQLHQSHSSDKEKSDLLMSHPGYVLVKAKELVQHAPHKQ